MMPAACKAGYTESDISDSVSVRGETSPAVHQFLQPHVVLGEEVDVHPACLLHGPQPLHQGFRRHVDGAHLASAKDFERRQDISPHHLPFGLRQPHRHGQRRLPRPPPRLAAPPGCRAPRTTIASSRLSPWMKSSLAPPRRFPYPSGLWGEHSITKSGEPSYRRRASC